jgi:hypothetical protein
MTLSKSLAATQALPARPTVRETSSVTGFQQTGATVAAGVDTAAQTRARLPAGQAPVLLVIVDTEGEFAWDQPFNRHAVGTASIANQPLMHERVFDKFGIVPTYMVDWPVTTTPSAVDVLRGLLDAGRCEIGAHLHPWVSPPYEEELSDFNSYAGNLPRQLEYDKLRLLTEAIVAAFGTHPLAFKAGRYGLGPHTAESIAALGYEVDASVVPYSTFTNDGGPDFRHADEHPYWFQAGQRSLLELPVTTGYCGWLRERGRALHELAQQEWARRLHLGGILARTRALERVRLSPEVANGAEMRRLTRSLLAGGCQVFSLTYHSPSMAPGHTPYVRCAADLERLISSVDEYCTWFRDEMGGQFMSMGRLRQTLASR